MEIKEEWRTIEEYPNYQISSLGRVKSLKFGKERILKQGKRKDGYCCVDLSKEGKRKIYLVHRLVCTAFLPNPDNLPQVNHKDENKQNNCASNLEYCTAKYNLNYGLHNERVAKSNSKPILQFNREGTKIIGKWESIMQVERELGISNSSITKCCKGKLKSCAGSKWMYLEDYVNRMEKLYNLALKKVS